MQTITVDPSCAEAAKLLEEFLNLEGSGYSLIVTNHVRRCDRCRKFNNWPYRKRGR